MNLRHLVVFVAVCEHMNMTRAARALYMTQPAVSQVIAELEQDYQVRLFERLKHRLFLTAAGQRLLPYARHMINLEARARQDLAGLSRAGAIRVGASQTVGSYLLPEIIAKYQQQLPEVEMFTRVENTREIERLLLEDQLDLGLVEGRIHSADLLERTILDDELVIVCKPGHPLTQVDRVTPEQLGGYGFIVREEGSGTREVFSQQMAAAGAGWKEAGIYTSSVAIKRAVEQGLGLGVLPVISLQAELQQATLHRLAVEGLNLHRKFALIFHRQKYFTPAMHAFEACLEE